ncbi:unnamed protein product [Closterium sp. NIES-65]|nr:unnamed protein product [Closterium sp. NIES-65]
MWQRRSAAVISTRVCSLSRLSLPRPPPSHPATSHNATSFPSVPLDANPLLATQSSHYHAATSTDASTSASSACGPAAFSAAHSKSSGSTPVNHALVAGGAAAERAVGGWLMGCAAWVWALVVLGGVTRLTRSGLSMTDWKFSGEQAPRSEEEWRVEFDKYRQSPEFKRVNSSMTIDEFKFIYWMEYSHRMWGRALGLLFLLPAAYFAARGRIKSKLAARCAVLFGLGGAQGLIGWWMVKSGLEEPANPHAVPRVSPYRLAAHLTSAFVIFSGIFWTALNVLFPTPPASTPAQLLAAAKLRPLVHPVAMLLGVTAFSGAFVAGNDAGRAFNTFPHMGDHWVPPEILEMTPLHRNLFENTATVQFQHRVLAISTLAAVTGMWYSARKLPLHPRSALLLNTALGITALQVTLGISALLTYVPVSLGSAHQAGALTLFAAMLALMHSLRRPNAAASATAVRAATAAASKSV